ncbi:MAG: xanthine dehydrogenase family protein molybdopterin-binding subunit [Acetobacteraceae bacterium]
MSAALEVPADRPFRHVGQPRSRVDGRLKVTGGARYAAEFDAPNLLHGVAVPASIARGRIRRIDTEAAAAVPGVVHIYTHGNRPPIPASDQDYQDAVAPPGKPFRPLFNDQILFSGQPVALVVAETLDAATYAASLVRVDAEAEPHETNLERNRFAAYVPPEKRSGIAPPPETRGFPDAAFNVAPVQIRNEYHVESEHHNPMEPHASTAIWEGDGRLTVYDKIQGVMNSHAYITGIFGLDADQVHVLSPFVGGAFGSGLRPQYQLFLAVMATLDLKRSVRVVLSREQMFTIGYRPETINSIALGANADGTLRALKHSAIARTSTFEDYQEVVVNWSNLLYRCENVGLDYKLVKLDTDTPCDMRAPGAPLGVFAIETAMDELAYAVKRDPLELRTQNFADTDEIEGKPFSTRSLREACRQGAEKFGWSGRPFEPRSMREGKELIGWGMATGIWEAMMTPHTARACLTADGKLEVGTATADIGTGTYTMLTQVAADALGLPMEAVTARLGDSRLPKAPVEGGSWTTASAGTAVHLACRKVADTLLGHARRMPGSPFANTSLDHVTFADGRIVMRADPSKAMTLTEVMQAAGVPQVEAEETAEPDPAMKQQFSSYTHSAVFAEVRVDEQLGVVRLTRIVSAVAAGRIVNPKTARSQIIGGVVFGVGMALHEESMLDHRLGRFMNHNLAEYHVPSAADIPDIDVLFVDEVDERLNPLGVKGLGEIGIVGTAAAIGNAIFHATGKRLRHLPMTLERVRG